MKINFILFTDGSVRIFDEHRVSAYGCVVLDVSTKRYTTFGGPMKQSDSIVYVEAWAIYRGLQYINKICKQRSVKPNILIVSDSKLNVEIMTHYIPKVWNLNDWDNWRKTDGSKVKNQELYRNIVELIIQNNLHVKFIHIHGHTTEREQSKVYKELKHADIKVPQKLCKVFVKMNAIADEIATDITMAKKTAIKNKAEWKELKTSKGA